MEASTQTEARSRAIRTLVVEDDELTLEYIAALLRERGHQVTACADGERAWAACQEQAFDLYVLDWVLPGIDGLSLCRRIRALPGTEASLVLVITARDSADDLVEALEAGADDYLSKPFEERLAQVRFTVAERRLEALFAYRRAQTQIAALSEDGVPEGSFHGMVGTSPAMQAVYRKIRLAGESDVTVMILGESGAGKELAARAIHEVSDRRDRPFVAVNCSAIPDALLESELFGHVRGAFTGAVRDKAGMFRAASGGTLFLDEIGDISPLLQVKLLRALQEREIRRVGDERTAAIDVRLLSATNRDPAELVAQGAMREDFYYRVKVFDVRMPPLRERVSDLPLLVGYFIRRLGRTTGKRVTGISPDALRRVQAYAWPGNVRELRNAIEYAFVTVSGQRIEVGNLPEHVHGPIDAAAPAPARRRRLSPAEQRSDIERALDETGGNRTAAAELLGISRVTLWKRMRRLGMLETSGE